MPSNKQLSKHRFPSPDQVTADGIRGGSFAAGRQGAVSLSPVHGDMPHSTAYSQPWPPTQVCGTRHMLSTFRKEVS
ncbi:unnamed protein product [Protopolystoma xenopodis]|uniref:Uncharacterized protein n=1 Tax=Protopolystoma xenopodis TaxID=117903 RepID=A0A448WS32_9PLAT|nr:unnamed protein product [Protopolystoma xenopodis]